MLRISCLTVVLSGWLLTGAVGAQEAELTGTAPPPQGDLTLFYRQPATKWVEALPPPWSTRMAPLRQLPEGAFHIRSRERPPAVKVSFSQPPRAHRASSSLLPAATVPPELLPAPVPGRAPPRSS